jgi:catechol-2,3-dioxygenase
MSASFSHAGIFVSDLELMASFYQRVLGLTETDRGVLNGADIRFLSASPAEHHQIVLVAGRPREPQFNPINQLSFRVADLSALRAMLVTLRDEEDVQSISPVSHGNALSIYFPDPEGNRLEVYIDTPWYVAQPLRVEVDLDRPEDDIWRDLESAVSDLPGFVPIADWRTAIATRMQS